MDKRITFKIDERLSDAFDAEAIRQHRSRSNLLEQLIIKLIAERYVERIQEEMTNEELHI